MDDFLHEEQLPSVEDYIEKDEEVVEQIEETDKSHFGQDIVCAFSIVMYYY